MRPLLVALSPVLAGPWPSSSPCSTCTPSCAGVQYMIIMCGIDVPCSVAARRDRSPGFARPSKPSAQPPSLLAEELELSAPYC